MSERFEQASLEGLDLDEQLADLPLQRTPSAREGGAAPPAEQARSGDRRREAVGDEVRSEGAGGNLDLFGDGEDGDSEASGLEADPPAPESADRAGEEAEDTAEQDRAPASAEGEPTGQAVSTESPASARVSPSPPERLLGGLADLTVHVGVLAAALLAMSALSLAPTPAQWPGFLVFLLCFSFLYHVVPLAFWGQTPGMAWRGLRARDRGGRPLSFGQAGLRWTSALLTAVLLGLPLLLAFGEGGSLSDRITRSQTLRRP